MFKLHALTEHDMYQGSVLSPLQRQVIENRIMELGASILNAEATSEDPKYFEKLNFTKGQMAELTSWLESSKIIEQQLNTAKE